MFWIYPECVDINKIEKALSNENEYVSIDDYGEVQPAKLYKCEYCGYETDKEEEVWCWKCGKGQMLYQEQENEHFK